MFRTFLLFLVSCLLVPAIATACPDCARSTARSSVRTRSTSRAVTVNTAPLVAVQTPLAAVQVQTAAIAAAPVAVAPAPVYTMPQAVYSAPAYALATAVPVQPTLAYLAVAQHATLLDRWAARLAARLSTSVTVSKSVARSRAW